MSKKIRFFIDMNGTPIRSLEELEDNFHIQDIMRLYKGGVLERWLDVHEYNDALENLRKLPAKMDDKKMATELIHLFNPSCTEDQIKEALYCIHFDEDYKKDMKQYLRIKQSHEEWMKEYLSGYYKLLKEIEKLHLEEKFLIEAVRKLKQKYWDLVCLDFDAFIESITKKAPYIVFYMMGGWLIPQEYYKKMALTADKILREEKKNNFKKLREYKSQYIFIKEQDSNRNSHRSGMMGVLSYSSNKYSNSNIFMTLAEDKKKILIIYGNGVITEYNDKSFEKGLSVASLYKERKIFNGLLWDKYSGAEIVYMDITDLPKLN